MNPEAALLPAFTAWARDHSFIQAVVLYGSAARKLDEIGAPDRWSDIDLHAIVDSPRQVEEIDWEMVLPGKGYCLRAVRGASGGVRKLTILFAEGELEIVVLSAFQLRLARFAMRVGFHRKLRSLNGNLNVLATGLQGGFLFLKGEDAWGNFYRRVASEMPGIRISDEAARGLANAFLCDFLCLLKRLERGESIAAQHALHQRLSEANLILLRELRLRRGQPVPSFEVGRRLESLIPAEELKSFRVNARLDRKELCVAAWHSFSTLKDLLKQIDPEWRAPAEVVAMLIVHSGGIPPR